MMNATSESPLKQAQAYRSARRAFIAACEKRHLDSIARLSPARSPDEKPLFMDAVALGPRLANRAVLVVARASRGAQILTQLLLDGLAPPNQTRVVLVHALDPAAFAGAQSDPDWAGAMLAAVVTEDLSRVHKLAVLDLDKGKDLTPTLCLSLPKSQIAGLDLVTTAPQALSAIAAFLAE
jgi:Protein of unknown function (DUF2817)